MSLLGWGDQPSQDAVATALGDLAHQMQTPDPPPPRTLLVPPRWPGCQAPTATHLAWGLLGVDGDGGRPGHGGWRLQGRAMSLGPTGLPQHRSQGSCPSQRGGSEALCVHGGLHLPHCPAGPSATCTLGGAGQQQRVAGAHRCPQMDPHGPSLRFCQQLMPVLGQPTYSLGSTHWQLL